MATVAAVIASTDYPFHYRVIASPHGPVPSSIASGGTSAKQSEQFVIAASRAVRMNVMMSDMDSIISAAFS